MSLIRIQKKGQITIPTLIRSRLGLAEGDLVDVKLRSTTIVVTPQVVIDHSKFPNADDEYTPEQRRIVEARLAQALEEVKKGHVSHPFDTVEEMAAALRKDARKLKGKTKSAARQ